MVAVIAIVGAFLAGCGKIGFDPSATSDGSAQPQTYRELVLSDLPVGYWRLDDLDSTARDELGVTNGTYNGTCQHAITGAIAMDPDTAVRFDGATCYIQLPDAFPFVGNSPFSIEVWASMASLVGYQHYVTRESRDVTQQPVDGYALLYDPSGVKLERTFNSNNVATPFAAIASDVFIHIVGVYDGVNEQLYIDGAIAGDPQPDTDGIAVFAFQTLIGVSSVAQQYAFVDGVLDEVAIYDHALAPDRIALHYTVGTQGPQ